MSIFKSIFHRHAIEVSSERAVSLSQALSEQIVRSVSSGWRMSSAHSVAVNEAAQSIKSGARIEDVCLPEGMDYVRWAVVHGVTDYSGGKQRVSPVFIQAAIDQVSIDIFNVKDDAGNTAVHLAVMEMVNFSPFAAANTYLLAKAGANFQIANAEGKTPEDIISDKLQELGAMEDLPFVGALPFGATVERVSRFNAKVRNEVREACRTVQEALQDGQHRPEFSINTSTPRAPAGPQ